MSLPKYTFNIKMRPYVSRHTRTQRKVTPAPVVTMKNTTDHKSNIYVSFLPVLLYNVSSNPIHPHRGAEPEHNKNNVLPQDASSSSF